MSSRKLDKIKMFRIGYLTVQRHLYYHSSMIGAYNMRNQHQNDHHHLNSLPIKYQDILLLNVLAFHTNLKYIDVRLRPVDVQVNWPNKYLKYVGSYPILYSQCSLHLKWLQFGR